MCKKSSKINKNLSSENFLYLITKERVTQGCTEYTQSYTVSSVTHRGFAIANYETLYNSKKIITPSYTISTVKHRVI